MAAAIKGAIRQAEREQRNQQWLAWHVAALSRAERLPTFEKFMGGKSKPRRQTPEEIMAIFSSLVGPPPEAEA
jgi:hypothetical protein